MKSNGRLSLNKKRIYILHIWTNLFYITLYGGFPLYKNNALGMYTHLTIIVHIDNLIDNRLFADDPQLTCSYKTHSKDIN